MPWCGCLDYKNWNHLHVLHQNHVSFPNYGQLHEPQATKEEYLFITIQNHSYKKKNYYPSKCNRSCTPLIDGGFPRIVWRTGTHYRAPGNANDSPKWTFIICHIYNQISRSYDCWSMRFDSFKIISTGNNFCIKILKVANPFKFDLSAKCGMAITCLNMGSSCIPISNNCSFIA